MNRFKSMHIVMACAVTVLALGLSACDQVESAESDVVAEHASAPAVHSSSPVVTIPPPFMDYDGESRLVRTKNGINFRFTTSGLNPGHAYTLWFVAFNAPDACANMNGCTPGDLFNPAVDADMMFGAGHVVGASGDVTFSGRMNAGDVSGSAQIPLGVASNGLTSPYDAEIHLVVRDHGPKISEYMPGMIQSLAAGCTDAGQGAGSPWNNLTASPGYADEFGRLGPNTCSSVLLSMHRP